MRNVPSGELSPKSEGGWGAWGVQNHKQTKRKRKVSLLALQGLHRRPGLQLKHASLACSACASSSLMAKEMDKRLNNYWQQDPNIPLNISNFIREVVTINQSLISS